MKALYFVVLAAVLVSVRVAVFRTRKRRRRAASDTSTAAASPTRRAPTWPRLEAALGDVGKVAGREINERIRGRIFRVGTLLILLVVAGAIVIPKVTSSSSSGGSTAQTAAIVGTLPAGGQQLLMEAAQQNDDTLTIVNEPTVAAASAALRADQVDLVVIDGDDILLKEPASDTNSPADSGLVNTASQYLGVLKAYHAGGLTQTQQNLVTNATGVPVHTLSAGKKAATKSTSIIGLVLLFFMLTQYNTWILIGVMQEKSSRVVEVLLAAVRPLQLLGGKVLGIGLVALSQATLIVGFALALGAIVGSDFLHGSGPTVLLAQLLWLVLGYAFYCWVYAAAGSTAERQDQVQTLALPLSIPILIGYIFSITVASSGHADLLFRICAYLPPTAPFCMPVLVGIHDVTWWQFGISVLITLGGTAVTARLAARIYLRAVLRTGSRVKLRQLMARPGG